MNLLKESTLVVVLFILLAFFMLNANPFRGETVAPMDLLANAKGWQNSNVVIDNIHPERSDVLDGKLPSWLIAKRCMRKGHIPTWNYVPSGGTPLISLFTNSIFTPAFLTFYLFDDDATGFYFSNLVNLVIGLLGMCLLLKMFFTAYASFLGSVVFIFSGFNAAWFFWPHFNTSIWIPWVLMTVYGYLNTKKNFYLTTITLSMLLMNVGGFPSVAVYGYISVLLMVLLYLFDNFRWIEKVTVCLNIFFASLLAMLIALPVILPLHELLLLVDTGYRTGGTTYKLSDLLLFVYPDKYGFPRVEKTLYVGYLPLLSLPIAIIMCYRGKNYIFKYALCLLIFSVTIVFALISPNIIRLIPTFSSNPWNRLSVLIGLSFSIIFAYAFNEILDKVKREKVVFYALIGIVGFIQIVDQKLLFNSFNNSVPNQSFYPQTKTIDYVKKNIKEFQYVVADKTFFISGTLGAYGINEWFAHGFKLKGEKKVLSKIVQKPFKTATASYFNSEQIVWNCPEMDLLNIKYLLCSGPILKKVRLFTGDGHRPAPPMPDNKIIQFFEVKKKLNISGISLLMATFHNKNFPSDVMLTIKRDGKLLAEAVVEKKNIGDNQWVYFSFDHDILLISGMYTLSIEILSDCNHKKLTAWCCTDSNSFRYLEVNGKKTDLSLKMKLVKRIDLPQKYKLHELEKGVQIYENENVHGSAYFIDTLDTEKLKMSYHDVDTAIITNDKIQIRYKGEKKGWVVIPMRSYPGWNVYIDGKLSRADKLLGMLPAIRVSKHSSIEYLYEPENRKLTMLISLISLVTLIFVSFLFIRREVLKKRY